MEAHSNSLGRSLSSNVKTKQTTFRTKHQMFIPISATDRSLPII